MLRAAGLTHARISKVNQLLVSLFTNMMKCVLALAMPQLVLWFLLTPALVLSQPVPTVSDMAPSPMPTPPPDCPIMCGDVYIPYPFGIGSDCAWPGLDYFTVTCNHSSNPPRPYTGNIEIIDITLETGEMRVVSPVAHICYNSSKTIDSNETTWQLNFVSPYLISPKRNEFTAIGCDTLVYLKGRDDRSYSTGCITTCVSLDGAAHDGDPCAGLGCCQMSYIPSNLSTITVYWGNNDSTGAIADNRAWEYSPCSYAFMAQKGWYNFSRKDLNGIGDYGRRVGERSIPPLVLDWAIRSNGTCPPPPAIPIAPACVSAHSYCINATQGQGYLCNCSEGYSGNPYVTGGGGCTNINECELQKSYPTRYEKQYPCQSGSTCHDTEGGYECKCNFWLRGDGKTNKGCQPIFPTPTVATVATLCGIVPLVVLWFVRREHKTRARQRREFFDRNGGRILTSLNINLIPKAQLDKITNNYSTSIGNGNFGEVFSGTNDDNQRVAVKKLKRSVKVDEEAHGKEYFVDEVIIQSQISHPNLVRLLGCCLDTEVPMLVVEFVPNGSLFDAVHARGAARRSTLPLAARLDIAIGTAEALAYMHSERDGCKILHGDVKSGNILLDDNFQPKVSDFGLSKLLSSTDKKYAGFVAGDRGYMDPVYMQTGLLTEKSDVYSFGVVLLELITGKAARYNGNNSLPLDFKKSYETRMNRAREMLDETFTSATDTDCLEKIGAIAVHCLKEDVDERPTMAQVVDDLKLVKMKMQKPAA